jgi:hypothetical protein
MLKYQYKINEEITRWTTEVYIKSNPNKNWYIAFTNPTAGPWKKITVKNEKSKSIEVYRFDREEKRPDLVLINDKKGVILIVEAKYDLGDLLNGDQMVKSVKVVVDMAEVLKNISVKEWETRKKYKILTSFLWYSSNPVNALAESKLVNKKYHENITKGLSRETVNIIIYKKNEVLTNLFITENKIHNDIDKI